jgi:hypothetical protein
LWHLLKFFQYIKYSILEFTPSIILLYPPPPPPPILGIVSTGLIFPFTNMYTVFAPCSPSLSLLLPLPLVLTLQTGPVLPSSDFAKRKKRHFYLFKIAIQGVSLCLSFILIGN